MADPSRRVPRVARLAEDNARSVAAERAAAARREEFFREGGRGYLQPEPVIPPNNHDPSPAASSSSRSLKTAEQTARRRLGADTLSKLSAAFSRGGSAAVEPRVRRNTQPDGDDALPIGDSTAHAAAANHPARDRAPVQAALSLIQQSLPSRLSIRRTLRGALRWARTICSIILVVGFVCLVAMLGALVFSAVIEWVTWAFATADHWTDVCCQWIFIRRFCASICYRLSWLGVYGFPAACSSPVVKSLHVGWAGATVDFDVPTDKIPQLLSVQLALNGHERRRLLSLQDQVCSSVDEISDALPRFYVHAARFSESLIRQINSSEVGMQRMTEDGSPRELSMGRNEMDKTILDLVSTWQRYYDVVEGPGARLNEELIKPLREQVAELQALQDKARRATIRAVGKSIKTFPLARRAGRWFGLLQLDADELEPLNEANRVLDGWSSATQSLGSLIVMIDSNSTEVSQDLRKLASTLFAADVRYSLGSNGLFDLQSFIIDLEQQAQGIKRKSLGQLKKGEETSG
ncbi:MAG: hypothetical protein LQ341_001003 [Variospora aurantia]|nr:MAG: hypothetical protein LQ341_001003 [Variospora aurantia]